MGFDTTAGAFSSELGAQIQPRPWLLRLWLIGHRPWVWSKRSAADRRASGFRLPAQSLGTNFFRTRTHGAEGGGESRELGAGSASWVLGEPGGLVPPTHHVPPRTCPLARGPSLVAGGPPPRRLAAQGPGWEWEVVLGRRRRRRGGASCLCTPPLRLRYSIPTH